MSRSRSLLSTTVLVLNDWPPARWHPALDIVSDGLAHHTRTPSVDSHQVAVLRGTLGVQNIYSQTFGDLSELSCHWLRQGLGQMVALVQDKSSEQFHPAFCPKVLHVCISPGSHVSHKLATHYVVKHNRTSRL
jgi:hypothetical protein